MSTKRAHRKTADGKLPSKGAELTTAEVAKRMGITEQRVRQLEAAAMRKLREVVELREHIQ